MSARFSYVAMISALFGGAITSSMAMVTPDRVAHRKPVSFSASSALATSTFGYVSASSLTITESCFLPTS